jgi:quaternary ammonium compound-resistance protein SugE
VSWLALVISGVVEAVWGHCVGAVGRLHPTDAVPDLRGLVVPEHGGLGLRDAGAPVSTAYAVWVGIGASLTVAYGMLTGIEPASVLKVVLVVGIVCCVVALKYLH